MFFRFYFYGFAATQLARQVHQERTQVVCVALFYQIDPTAAINHVKYLRAGPAEMPFRNWYTANTNYCELKDSVNLK